jgi:hypothetical protein
MKYVFIFLGISTLLIQMKFVSELQSFTVLTGVEKANMLTEGQFPCINLVATVNGGNLPKQINLILAAIAFVALLAIAIGIKLPRPRT